MTLRIQLSPDAEAKLRERAAASGKDLESFAHDAILEKLARPRSFSDAFAPLHDAFAEGAVSGDELDALFTRLRDEVWQAQPRTKKSA